MKSMNTIFLPGILFISLLFVCVYPAFAVFPNNPLPDTVKMNNPLRNEAGYTYSYVPTNSLTMPNPSPASENFIVDKVKGFRECSNAACHQSYWYKQNGWTISTHGLFGSRAGGSHSGLDIAAPIGTDVYAVDAGTVTFQYNNLQVGEDHTVSIRATVYTYG